MTAGRTVLVAGVQGLTAPVIFLAAWQVSSSREWINAFFFPPPSSVALATWAMLVDGSLAREIGGTLYRFTVGAGLGCFLGLAAGIAMGASEVIRRAGQPLIATFYTTPKVALLPLVMLILGIGDASRIALIAAVTFIILALQAQDAIRAVEPQYVEMARNYGAGRWDVVRRVYLPASLPQIFTGLRIALSRALVTLISLEMVSSTDGIGAMIWNSWESLATVRLYVGVLAAIAIGLAMHGSLMGLETAMAPWRRRRK